MPLKLNKHYIPILSIVLSLFLGTNCYATDLLDSIKSNTKLVRNLKDLYRVFEIHDKIADQNELLEIALADADSAVKPQLDTVLDNDIRICEDFEKIKIYDDSLNLVTIEYLKSAIRNYRVAKTKGFESDVFKIDLKKFNIEKHKFLDYISKACQTSRFINMTEDTYWKTIDKKNYIKSPAYPRYKKMSIKDLNIKLNLLDSIAKKIQDFQEFSIYRIELADQYVKHRDSIEEDKTDSLQPEEKAVVIYKTILDQRKYCLYLFESWLKWRTVYQENNGLSKYSDIPNDMYNKVREQEAALILKRIAEDGKDEMCINQFLLFATHDIVRRFGDYPYGNQNTVEFHEIFDDPK